MPVDVGKDEADDEERMAEKLTQRQQVFVERYLICWNASEAARQAGYTAKPNMAGPRLMAKDSIKARIAERMKELAMEADEVVKRLSDIARGDIGNYLEITRLGSRIDLHKAQEAGLTHLIQKVKDRTTISSRDGEDIEIHETEIEPYSALDALKTLAKIRGLMKDEVSLPSEIVVKVVKGASLDEL